MYNNREHTGSTLDGTGLANLDTIPGALALGSINMYGMAALTDQLLAVLSLYMLLKLLTIGLHEGRYGLYRLIGKVTVSALFDDSQDFLKHVYVIIALALAFYDLPG